MHKKADRRRSPVRRTADAASIEKVIDTLDIARRQLEEHDVEYHHRTPSTVYDRIKHLVGCLKDPTKVEEDVMPGGLTILEKRRDEYKRQAAEFHKNLCYKDEAVATLSASVMSEAICLLRGVDPMEGI